jgi:hypothetical protein
MASAVYVLGFLVTALCAVLLLRGYARSRQRLLLWSGLCFVGLTLSYGLLLLDMSRTDVDLYVWRLAVAAAAMSILSFGLIWDSK